MEDYNKIQSLENNIESLQNGIYEYIEEYNEKKKENTLEKDKLKKYLIPLIFFDVVFVGSGIYLNSQMFVDSYILASLSVLASIPNFLILDRYRFLFKSVKETKDLEESIDYLKGEKEKQEEKLEEIKYNREPIYISEYSYEQGNDKVRKLIRKKDK